MFKRVKATAARETRRSRSALKKKRVVWERERRQGWRLCILAAAARKGEEGGGGVWCEVWCGSQQCLPVWQLSVAAVAGGQLLLCSSGLAGLGLAWDGMCGVGSEGGACGVGGVVCR